MYIHIIIQYFYIIMDYTYCSKFQNRDTKKYMWCQFYIKVLLYYYSTLFNEPYHYCQCQLITN